MMVESSTISVWYSGADICLHPRGEMAKSGGEAKDGRGPRPGGLGWKSLISIWKVCVCVVFGGEGGDGGNCDNNGGNKKNLNALLVWSVFCVLTAQSNQATNAAAGTHDGTTATTTTTATETATATTTTTTAATTATI